MSPQTASVEPNPLDAIIRDGSMELYELVRNKIVEPGGLFFSCKFIIGFFDLTVRAHLPLSMFYEDDTILSKLVEFPKSHLKSSIGTVALILHRFMRRVVRGEDPTDRIAIASNTKQNAMRFLGLLKRVPQNNRIFQHFFPELIPEFSNEDVWNQQEIVFPRGRDFTDPSVDTLGVGGAATSRHYTGIVEDDMLKEEDADSPSAIRKAIELHQYYTSLLVDDFGWMLTNEHAWNQFDLNKHIIDNEPDTAVLSVGATNGFNFKRSRGIPPEILERCKVWGSDGDTVWPERFGVASLVKRRQKAGSRVFNAVYENDPFDPDVVDFKEEWLRYYEWNSDKDIRILPAKGTTMEIVKMNELNIVAAYDPALSKKTDACRSALVVVGIDPKDRVFMLDVVARRDDPLKLLNMVFSKIQQWHVNSCGIETVLFQKVLQDLLIERCEIWNEGQRKAKKTGFIWPGTFAEVKPPRGSGPKDARLRALIGTCFEDGKVYIRRDQGDFIDEYLHFPLGRTRDILDAFAYTSLLWFPGESEESIESQLAEERRWLNQRDSVTGY